ALKSNGSGPLDPGPEPAEKTKFARAFAIARSGGDQEPVGAAGAGVAQIHPGAEAGRAVHNRVDNSRRRHVQRRRGIVSTDRDAAAGDGLVAAKSIAARPQRDVGREARVGPSCRWTVQWR